MIGIWPNARKLGLALLVLVSVTQLVDWLGAWVRKPSYSVEALVQFGSFDIPDGLEDEFKRIRELANFERLRELLKVPQPEDEGDAKKIQQEFNRLTIKFASLLRDRAPMEVPREFGSLSGYWDVRVVNHGTSPLSDVSLVLPAGKFLRLHREGSASEFRTCREVVQLGDVRPGEEAELLVWADSEPNEYMARRIRLTHAKGIGNVVVIAPEEPWGYWLRNNWGVVFFSVLMLATFSFFVWTLVSDHRKQAPRPG